MGYCRAPLPSAEHRPRAVLVAGLAQGSFDPFNHGIEGMLSRVGIERL